MTHNATNPWRSACSVRIGGIKFKCRPLRHMSVEVCLVPENVRHDSDTENRSVGIATTWFESDSTH
jgi:hypothetical protein